jgi:ADP-ribose pyrophosphatase YjhB (NUDIX family)
VAGDDVRDQGAPDAAGELTAGPSPEPSRERALDPAEVAMLAAIGRGDDGRSTDIASGLGAPRWVARTLNFCANCGTRLVHATPETEHRERSVCPSCGFIAYVNPRLVVTTIPVNSAGEAVLIRRGIEPGKGSWAQPGGFLEVDETVAEAAVRETLEETGLLVEPGVLVGLYSRLEAAVVVLVYEARITGGTPRQTPEALEIAGYPPADIPWDSLAFKTTFWALRDWVALRSPATLIPDEFRGWEQF